MSSLPEIYDPKTNTWTDLTSAKLTSPLYPFMFLLSNGRVFDAGPDTVTTDARPRHADLDDGRHEPIRRDERRHVPARQDHEGRRMGRPGFQRRAEPALHRRRAHCGDRYERAEPGLALDGADGRRSRLREPHPAPGRHRARQRRHVDLGWHRSVEGVLPAEIWNPDTETWTTVASLANPREYHSTALLLPDGRVLMSGGGRCPERQIRTTPRSSRLPTSSKAPGRRSRPLPAGAAWGSSFDVTTPDAASITKVSLIRSPSVTHASTRTSVSSSSISRLAPGRSPSKPRRPRTSLLRVTTCSSSSTRTAFRPPVHSYDCLQPAT